MSVRVRGAWCMPCRGTEFRERATSLMLAAIPSSIAQYIAELHLPATACIEN